MQLRRSVYAVVLDAENPNYSPNREYAYLFVRAQENYLNHFLQTRGHVLLNDVYDVLGVRRTRLGATHGWAEDAHVRISFEAFVDSNDETPGPLQTKYLLDFNVQGDILNKI